MGIRQRAEQIAVDMYNMWIIDSSQIPHAASVIEAAMHEAAGGPRTAPPADDHRFCLGD